MNIEKQINELLDFVKRLPFISKIKIPLNEEGAKYLIQNFGLENVKNQLEKMDNYNGIERKNNNVFFTCKKWFESDIRSGKFKKEIEAVQKVKVKSDLEMFFEKFPIGTKIVANNGYKATVHNQNFLLDEHNSYMPINQALVITWRKQDA